MMQARSDHWAAWGRRAHVKSACAQGRLNAAVRALPPARARSHYLGHWFPTGKPMLRRDRLVPRARGRCQLGRL